MLFGVCACAYASACARVHVSRRRKPRTLNSSPLHARAQDGDKAAGGSALLAALQQRNRVRPALLQAEVVLRSDADAPAASASGGVAASTAGGKEAPRKQQGQGDEEATLQLVLWRADALAAIVELDKSLAVVRADAAAGLLFGVSSKQLIKKDFRRWGARGRAGRAGG